MSDECKPTDGLYKDGDIECIQCAPLARRVCRIFAVENGWQTIAEIDGLIGFEEKEEDDI